MARSGKKDEAITALPLVKINELAEDPRLISWDMPDDPKYPQNWSLFSKWSITLTNSAFTFVTLASSTMIAPALPSIGKALSVHSDTQLQLCLSVYVLGYSFGPLLWAPLSELYGPFSVVQGAMALFFLWNLVAGFAENKSLMIAARLFAGIRGSSSLAVCSGINADIWAPSQRGRSLALASLFPPLGPAIGPIGGGYISQHLNWRWIFYLISMLGIAFQFLALFTMRETHAPILLHRRIDSRRNATAKFQYHIKSHLSSTQPLSRELYVALSRPLLILAFHPIVQLVSLYGAYSFGIMYLVISTFTTLWTETYHQISSAAGLNYISIGIGFTLGAQICGPVSDYIHRRLIRHRPFTPEMRTPLMLPSAILIPIGLLWYGWSVEARLHWIMPNVGIAIFGMGQQIGTQCIQAYMIEAFGQYAASRSAAVFMMKSLAGFGFPLFGPRLYTSLGWGWGILYWC